MAARKSTSRKPSSKRASDAEQADQPVDPANIVQLEVRVGTKIVFLQPVDKTTVDLNYSNNQLSLSATVVDDQPATALPPDQPLQANVVGAFPVAPEPDEDEPVVNPNVKLAVHAGERPAEVEPVGDAADLPENQTDDADDEDGDKEDDD